MKIDRTRTGNDWHYHGRDGEAVVGIFATIGVDVSKIDDWIEAEPWPDVHHRERVMHWRARLLDAWHAGNMEAVEAWALYLLTLVALDKRVSFLRPLALRDQAHSASQAARRKGKPATHEQIAERGVDRNAEIKRMHARLVEFDAPNPTSMVAAEFNISTRQVRRILRT